MNRNILLVTICLATLSWTTEAFICRSCEFTPCPPYNASECQYGTTKQICGCCDVCENGPGDGCWGTHGYLGGCGTGLNCQLPPGTKRGTFPRGVCVFEKDYIPNFEETPSA